MSDGRVTEFRSVVIAMLDTERDANPSEDDGRLYFMAVTKNGEPVPHAETGKPSCQSAPDSDPSLMRLFRCSRLELRA